MGGAFVAIHGADQIQAGIRQIFSGNQVSSLTSQGLQAAGMSPTAANLTDAGISIIGTAGASYASAAPATGTLVHLTDSAGGAGINSSGTLIGSSGITPQTGAGRARYSSPTLKKIIAGDRFDPPQPLLRRKNETPEQALNRYLADIKHPLVRHRLTLFQKQLQKLVSQFGKPDMIVLEAVRSLALGKEKKREYIQRIHDTGERTN